MELWYSCRYQGYDEVLALLKRGTDVNAIYNTETSKLPSYFWMQIVISI